MKDVKKETAKLLAGATDNIAKLVASSAFEMWKRKDFRLYVDFNNIDTVEQDRMFNELQVSVLGLFILHFESALTDATDERKMVLEALKKDLVPAFLALLSESGVESRYIKEWKYLIDLRLKEYRTDLRMAMEEVGEMEEFKKDEHLKIVWCRLQTITIDCLSHIRRGKLDEKDKMWNLLRGWLVTLEVQLQPITNLK